VTQFTLAQLVALVATPNALCHNEPDGCRKGSRGKDTAAAVLGVLTSTASQAGTPRTKVLHRCPFCAL
jgi:hypothetical protein